MRRAALIAAVTLGAVAGAQPASADSVWSKSFAETFRAACVPERLSFDGTVETAKAEGWSTIDPKVNAEFAAVMAKSDAGMADAKKDMPELAFRMEAFAREIDGRPLHLVVSFVESEVLNAIGCYLYDFAATAPIDAEAVTAMLGVEPANSMVQPGVIDSHVWGPAPTMPRTLDTYMTFIPQGSVYAEQTGFDGVVLKVSTSAPDAEDKG